MTTFGFIGGGDGGNGVVVLIASGFKLLIAAHLMSF
jgi:hypothetical protein